MNSLALLKSNKLSQTSSRIDILEVFLESDTGLTEKEIDERIDSKYDRATVYRTLKIFREKGIIHPIIAENEMTRYVLKKDPVEHIHFKRELCGNVFCLTEVNISGIKLPKGFIKKEANFLISGMCPGCN